MWLHSGCLRNVWLRICRLRSGGPHSGRRHSAGVFTADVFTVVVFTAVVLTAVRAYLGDYNAFVVKSNIHIYISKPM